MPRTLGDFLVAAIKVEKKKRRSQFSVSTMTGCDLPSSSSANDDESKQIVEDVTEEVSGNPMESDNAKIADGESENRADPEETMSLKEEFGNNVEVNSSGISEQEKSGASENGPCSSSLTNEAKADHETMESENSTVLEKNAKESSAHSCQSPETNESSKTDDSSATSSSGGKFNTQKIRPNEKENENESESVENDVTDVDPLLGFDPELDDLEEGQDDDLSTFVHISQEVTPMKPIKRAHTFLVDYNVLTQNKILSYPEVYVDNWQPGQVKLPCSHKCMLRLSRCTNSNKNKWKQERSQNQESKFSAVSHWEVVHARLSEQLYTIDDLLTAMEGYQPGLMDACGTAFRTFFNNYLNDEERAQFFSVLLPKLQQLALQLPFLVTQEVPLLAQNTNMSLTLSKKQIACLLANMFFNTFPCQDQSLPRNQNFFMLFCSKAADRQKSNFEKVKCLLNYFNRLLTQEEEKFIDLQGVVSFHRRCLDEDERPKWESFDLPLTSCQVRANGLIENQDGTLQVDFANRFIGGGVLGDGCVQEEIRFVTHPELYISLLFTPMLLDNECLIIQGAEKYCEYSGYSSTFKFTNNHVDDNFIDLIGRKMVTVVAIDATPYRSKEQKEEQYQVSRLLRELNKAYIGFKPAVKPSRKDERPTAVATGNWGCGAFGGDTTLKFIIQWMAASYAGRDVLYLTFHDKKLASDLNKVKKAFLKKPYTIKEIWKLLCRYNKSNGKQTLLDFLVS